MGDPEFRNDEKLLLRTPGINVKSVPFEGILTDRRIILVDSRNVLPPRDIPLATIRQVAAGENAIRDPTLVLHVAGAGGVTRQMVLTFSRDAGGNRARERDEWTRQLDLYTGQGRPACEPALQAPAKQPVSPVHPVHESPAAPRKRIIENAPPEPAPMNIPAETAAPAARETEAAAVPLGVFCIRCGNRVTADSAFCNRCGTPIVPPAPSPYAAAAPPAPAAPAAPYTANVFTVRPEPPAPVPAPAITDPTPGRDAIRIADDTPVRPPVRAPAVPAEPVNVPAPRKAPQPAASGKPKKEGFIPRLFSQKARSASRRSEPASPQEPGPEKPRRAGGSRPWKKILLAAVAVIIVIAVIAAGVVFVYPMLSKGGSSPASPSSAATPAATPQGQTTPSAQSTWAAATPAATTTVSIPQTGVWVHVSYLGGFKGTYGLSSELQPMKSSGDRVYEIVNATGPVQANFEKTDSSTRHEITVEIYKDGKLLTQGSTSAAFGRVALAADATTGVAQAPVASAGEPAASATSTSPATTPAVNATATTSPATGATGNTTTNTSTKAS